MQCYVSGLSSTTKSFSDIQKVSIRGKPVVSRVQVSALTELYGLKCLSALLKVAKMLHQSRSYNADCPGCLLHVQQHKLDFYFPLSFDLLDAIEFL